MQLKFLMAKLAGLVGARLLGAIIGFASQLVLARLLPVEEVGVVLLGMSAAAFISLAANGGYALLASTQLPKLTAHGRTSAAESFSQVAVMDTVLTYLALGAAGGLVVAFADFTSGQNTAILFGFLCAPASLALRYNGAVAMAARAFKTAYIPDFLLRPAAFLLGLLLASLAGWLHSASAALLVFVAITYSAAIGQAWFLGADGVSLRHLKWPAQRHAKAVRGRAFSLTLVAATLLAFADIVMVLAGFLLPERDLAVAGIALRLAAIAGFVLQAGPMLMMTDFTQALVRNDSASVDGLLRRSNLMTAGIAAAALLGTLLLGDFALSLFGEDYRAGKWVLVLFMLGQAIRALGGMNQQLLSIKGFQLRTAGACVLALAVLVGSSIVLCNQLGLMGLGYAVVAAELVWMLALAAQASQLVGRRGDILWVLAQR